MEYFREERDARTKAATGLPSVVTCICRCGVCTEVRSDGGEKEPLQVLPRVSLDR